MSDADKTKALHDDAAVPADGEGKWIDSGRWREVGDEAGSLRRGSGRLGARQVEIAEVSNPDRGGDARGPPPGSLFADPIGYRSALRAR